LSEEREEDVRTLFKKADKDPKILIVTDKLLTGYDAPLLYCLYLDKPMRDHVLLQAVARVNRPYVDGQGIQKRVGLVVDFVGVLRELRKALQFDSADVSGVIEDLDVLLGDFKQKIAKAGPSCAITSRPSIVWRNSTPPFHRLVEENATQQGLGRVTKSVTFDVKTLESPARRQRTGRGQGIQPGPTTAGGTRSKKFPHLTVMT